MTGARPMRGGEKVLRPCLIHTTYQGGNDPMSLALAFSAALSTRAAC